MEQMELTQVDFGNSQIYFQVPGSNQTQYDLSLEPNNSYKIYKLVDETGPLNSSHSHQFPPCEVCGDKSSGRNFGVFTCNGCRSFFRRTVKERRKFTCKYGGRCEITLNARLNCRACRYKKSLMVGMEPQSVIAAAMATTKDTDPDNWLLDVSPTLQDSHKSSALTGMLRHYREAESLLDLKFAPWFPHTNLRLPEGMQDVYESVNTKLRYVVEWAKGMDIFQNLDTQSKIFLLRAYCTELVNLETIRVSMDTGTIGEDCFMGANGLKIYGKSSNVKGTPARIFYELVLPCRNMNVSDEEFWCLKALTLFNPNTSGLSDKDRGNVGVFQQKIRRVLEIIMGEDKLRMFNLLMILQPLSNITGKFRADLSGYKREKCIVTYKLVDDLLVYDNDEKQ